MFLRVSQQIYRRLTRCLYMFSSTDTVNLINLFANILNEFQPVYIPKIKFYIWPKGQLEILRNCCKSSVRSISPRGTYFFSRGVGANDESRSSNLSLVLPFSNLNTFLICRIWDHHRADMFRFLFAKRGKGNISPPVETQRRNAQLATENIDMPATRTFQVLRPVLLVSAALTGYTHPRYRVQGVIGGFVWLTMLLAHGTLDFLAARQVYTYGWASVSISLFLLCFVCTVFSNRKMLPWLEKGMSVLEEEQKYPKTLERSAKVFKVRTWSSCYHKWHLLMPLS